MIAQRKSDQIKMNRREEEGEGKEKLHSLHSLAEAEQPRSASPTQNPVRHLRMTGKSA